MHLLSSPRTSLSLLSLLLLFGSNAIVTRAQQSGIPGEDSLFTIATSEPLVSWGNLGGVTVDRLGFIYVANFSDRVWRITPEGEVTTLTKSLYGASGNAVDSRGRLLQSNYYAHTVSRIERDGRTETLIADGLSGPVGIAVDPEDNFYVTNCNANSIAYVTRDGEVSTYAEGSMFACPNSIVLRPDGNLYVANFNNPNIVRIDSTGSTDVFATAGTTGNAHLSFARGYFYVTKIIPNALVRIAADGEVEIVVGGGPPGNHADGPASAAGMSRPNGITVSPSGQDLYINTLSGEWQSGKRSEILLRRVKLLTLSEILSHAAEEGGVEGLEAAYEAYKSSDAGAREETSPEATRLGYSFLSQIQLDLAVRLFELNAESYPEDAAAQYNLGEAYRYSRQPEKARSAYERVLALDPTHQAARSRLEAMDQ